MGVYASYTNSKISVMEHIAKSYTLSKTGFC